VDKTIITLAPLEQKPYASFPSAEDLADEIVECHEAGASALHLHVIDPAGNQTTDTTFFQRVVRRIRDKCDMVIEGSTGGSFTMTPDERSVALEVEDVEMASLNMGSANIGDNVYINSPKDIVFWAEKMRRHRIVPDMALFEHGMVPRITVLETQGLVRRPYCASLAMGFEDALPATPANLLSLVQSLLPGTVWTLVHHHSMDFGLQAMAVALGGHCRTGFEDTGHLTPHRKARSNVELVAALRDLIHQLGREVATSAEARRMLGLT
jgi:3-keto-5-aminohexanoate cleavage enzyme